MNKGFRFGEFWFISYHALGIPGSVYNTVSEVRPFDWLLEDNRASKYSIIFFCNIKPSRYDQLRSVLEEV